MTQRVVFLVGASGVGKTTVAQILERRVPWAGHTHYFDTIGVPPFEAMEAEFGSGEEWQRWATREWIARLGESDAELQLIEGQTRPSFIREAAAGQPHLQVDIILLDCPSHVREGRVTALRGQPELASPQMDCWAAYLAGQAHALGLPVIDTGGADPHAVADQIEERLGLH